MTKPGFATRTCKDLDAPRRRNRDGEGEAARRHGGKSEVTVYGTTKGVRADPQIGRRLDSQTIDETPMLGRKVTTLPLFNSAFRQGKGHRRSVRQRDVLHHRRRQPPRDDLHAGRREQRRGVGPSDDAHDRAGRRGAGRWTVLTNAFSAEFGWTSGPAMNIVTKSGTNALHGEGLFMGRPGELAGEAFSTPTATARRRCPRCVTPTTGYTANNQAADMPDS